MEGSRQVPSGVPTVPGTQLERAPLRRKRNASHVEEGSFMHFDRVHRIRDGHDESDMTNMFGQPSTSKKPRYDLGERHVDAVYLGDIAPDSENYCFLDDSEAARKSQMLPSNQSPKRLSKHLSIDASQEDRNQAAMREQVEESLNEPTFYSTPPPRAAIQPKANSCWSIGSFILPVNFWSSPQINEKLPVEGLTSGLRNRGNTCYMNSAIQTFSHVLEKHDPSKQTESLEIPDHVFKQLNSTTIFYRLRSDMHDLHKQLASTSPQNQTGVEQNMGKLIESFQGYERIKQITANPSRQHASMVGYRQQDPQEFLDNICEVMGFNTAHSSSLLLLTQLGLEKNNQNLYKRFQITGVNGIERSGILPLSIPENEADGTTLTSCVQFLLDKPILILPAECIGLWRS